MLTAWVFYSTLNLLVPAFFDDVLCVFNSTNDILLEFCNDLNPIEPDFFFNLLNKLCAALSAFVAGLKERSIPLFNFSPGSFVDVVFLSLEEGHVFGRPPVSDN